MTKSELGLRSDNLNKPVQDLIPHTGQMFRPSLFVVVRAIPSGERLRKRFVCVYLVFLMDQFIFRMMNRTERSPKRGSDRFSGRRIDAIAHSKCASFLECVSLIAVVMIGCRQ
jgi:hypothetical protein